MPDVWLYWRDVSRGGMVFNAHLAQGYHEEWDPVVRDNIMYSAYVQSWRCCTTTCSPTTATPRRGR